MATMLALALFACTETGVHPVIAAPHAPVVSIDEPARNAVILPACEAATLRATVRDADDDAGSLTVTWRLDGVTPSAFRVSRFGATSTLTYEWGALTTGGVHTATVTVTDPGALESHATRTFIVAANSLPAPLIFSPSEGEHFASDQEVPILVDVADADTGSAGAIALAWSIDDVLIQGPTSPEADGRASWAIDAGTLTPGRHRLRIDATDGCGVAVSAFTAFNVGCEPTTWYADADGDGYGDPGSSTEACRPPPETVADATDCDDEADAVHPEAPELCNGLDDDCDGQVDEDVTDPDTWYVDADGDGYGSDDATASGCEAPAGYVDNSRDGDDTDASVGAVASADDGTICPMQMGVDDGKVPTWTGVCDVTAGYGEYDGHCYYPVTDRTTDWEDARASCLAAGGHLATPTSDAETSFIYGLTGRTFAGACDGDTEGTFVWITGEPWSWTQWSAGEPNDSSPGEDCLEVDGDDHWNDIWAGYVSFAQGYTCEFEP